MKKLTLGLILVIVLLLSACSTSRQMQKQKIESKIDCTAIEKKVTNNDIVTETKRQVTSTTEITESVDTIVTVMDSKTRTKVEVPVKIKRVIKHQQFSSTQQVINDKSQSTENKSIHENKAVLNEIKQVKTKRPNLTLYIVIAASVLIVLLFVFLWKRNLFARLFDVFRR